MPLSPDSPTSKEIPGPVVEQNLNKMHIHDFRVNVNPNGGAGTKVQLDVHFTEGYEEGGVYNPDNHYHETFSGQGLEDALNENTTGGSFYGEIKAKLWAWLQAQGKAPAGDIT